MSLHKNTFVVTLGTLLEWAEFTFFAYMADDLSRIFFPADHLDMARLKIYGVFAASYFMRPAGAIFFGHIGDKYGRKPPMIASLLLMSVATFSIGVLPTYASIGTISSILLVVFRMMQGFAVGGEFNGSMVILTEHNKRRPFLAGSWTLFASTTGMVIGSCMATMVSSFSRYYENLWRIPFLLSSFLALTAIYLRKGMEETEDFQIAKKSGSLFQFPMIAAWKYNRRGLLCTAALSMFVSVYVYTGNVYYKTIAVNVGGLSLEKASFAISIGIGFSMCLIPILAAIADRTNAYKMCLISMVGAVFLSPVMIFLATTGKFLCTICGQLLYGAMDALTSATAYTILTQQFKTGTKYSGISFAWSITTALFGGTTLIFNEFLLNKTGTAFSCGLYMSTCALICLIVFQKTVNFSLYRSVSHPQV